VLQHVISSKQLRAHLLCSILLLQVVENRRWWSISWPTRKRVTGGWRNFREECACNETNLMHYLSSLYWVTTPLHVSGLLVAHHQEAAMYICITLLHKTHLLIFYTYMTCVVQKIQVVKYSFMQNSCVDKRNGILIYTVSGAAYALNEGWPVLCQFVIRPAL
jgi:hypothetical protein